MNLKEALRVCAGLTVGPVVSMFLHIIIRLQGVPAVRRKLGKLYDTLRSCSHKNYEENVKRKYKIHPTVYWGEDTLIYGDGELSIGEYSYCGRGSFLLSHPAGVKLIIGKYCSISHSVHIRTEVNKKKREYSDDLAAPAAGKDIIIGDYVWIGAHAFIVGGVSIGDNSIIGANSVVTHDVPPNSVYAGVPARLIGVKADYASL